MEDRLALRVIGQEGCHQPLSPMPYAATAPAWAIPTARSAPSLFLGPTGVGKTELCKALAEFLFDDETPWSAST